MKLIEAARSRKYGNLIKESNYFDEYDRMFFSIRENKIKILEIGVLDGGSLAMWEEYFPNAEIMGIDIQPNCKQYETKRSKIRIGDQEDKDFLLSLGDFDIIIDDGGHTMKQQIETYKILFPHLNNTGIYVIEDLHTSYWPAFNGRKGKAYTAIGLIKKLIDEIHVYASSSPNSYLRNKISHLRKSVSRNYSNDINIKYIHIAPGIAFIGKDKPHTDSILRL